MSEKQLQGADVGYANALEHHLLVGLVCVKILGIIVLFDPASLQTFEGPKSLFSRALMWPIGAMFVASILRFGWNVIPRSGIHSWVGAVLATSAVAAAFAEEPVTALFGERTRFLGLTFLFDMSVLYVAVVIAFRTTRDWALLAVSVTAGALASVVYALVQDAGRDPFKWVEYTVPFGTLGNANIFGHLLAVAFVGAATIFLVGGRTIPAALRVLVAGAALVLLTAIAVVGSRGALLGAAAGGFVSLLIWASRARALTRPGLAAVASVIVGLVILGAAWSTPGQRVLATLEGTGLQDRVLLYGVALDAIRDRPILGFGPDGFGVAYAKLHTAESRQASGAAINTSAHDWLLQAAVTTGLLGATMLIASLVAGLRALREASQRDVVASVLLASLVAYLTTGLVSVGSIGVDWVPWVVLGGAAGFTRAQARPRALVTGRGATAFTLAAFALGLVGSTLGWAAFQAGREAAASGRSMTSGDATTAVAAARRAVQLDPGRASYWNLYGMAMGQQGEWRAAGDAFVRATGLYGHDGAYWSNLAQARARQWASGDRSPDVQSSALAAARKAVSIDRFVPRRFSAMADVADLVGEPAAALDWASTAIRGSYADPRNDDVAARSALSLPNPAASRAALAGLVPYRDTATLRMALALLSLRLNDNASARIHASRAVELAPDNTEARALLRSIGGG